MKKSVGLVTLDMKFASLFREAVSKMGIKIIHALDIDELPLSVLVVVAKKSELQLENVKRRILYVEDYSSLEELIEKVLEALNEVESYQNVLIAIDPGKTIGVAYLVNGKIIKTSKYFYEESMLEDIKTFLERHREAEEKIIVIGSTTTQEELSRFLQLMTKHFKGIEGLRVEVIDEFRTTRGVIPREKGLSKDEYSAIMLSLRKKMKLRRVAYNADL